jgi:uncharacterized glyoxalase superfamily protein PhnB
MIVMASIEYATIEVADPAAASAFYAAAFGLGTQLRLRAAAAPTSGFRGFTLNLGVSQPATVNGFIDSALDAGGTLLKSATKQFWGGYSGVVQAPDGTIWKVATASKKDTGPATRQIDGIAILLGVADVAASKRFYVDRGFAVAQSYGRKFVSFAAPSGAIELVLYRRDAAAKDAGASPDGTGSHRLIVSSDAGPFTDPDGFVWEAAPARSTSTG